MISADEAIAKGRRMVLYPAIFFIAGTIALGLLLMFYEIIPNWSFIVFVASGPILVWVYWNFKVTEWKMWAFGNVRNVHELKKKAIRHKLIREDKSLFSQSEIKTEEQRKQLERIEKKFLEADIFHEDLSVPLETHVFYSKSAVLFGYVFSLILIGIGTYLTALLHDVPNVNSYIPCFIFYPLGILFLYRTAKSHFDKKPQMIINSLGIKLAKTELISWKNIHKDQIMMRREGKQLNKYFGISHTGGYDEIRLDGLTLKEKDLEHRLNVYRLRFKKNLA